MGANEKYEAAMHGREYAPTTDELRDIWVDYNLNPLPRSQGIPLVETAQADFDRWLATVRAEAKAEALEEAVSDFESNVGAGEFEEQSRDGDTFWRHVAEAWEAQGPYMQWLRNRANQLRNQS